MLAAHPRSDKSSSRHTKWSVKYGVTSEDKDQHHPASQSQTNHVKTHSEISDASRW